MNIIAVIALAWRTLMRHKTRSTLTTLGIVIGVGSVVAMVAIGSGARVMIEEQIATMGVNYLMIFAGSTRSGAVRGGAGTVSGFTEDDAKAVLAECRTVQGGSPLVRFNTRAIAGNENWPTRVFGVYPGYFPCRGWTIAEGQAFTDEDQLRMAKVCLLGQTVVENLYPDGGSPLDTTVRIEGAPFRVIGVLARKGQASWGEDQDDLIYAPFSTVQRRLMNIMHINSIECSVVSADLMDEAVEEITALLRQRQRLREGEENNFFIGNQVDALKSRTATSRVMQVLLGVIASVSLLVGAIGIMNIMLVSVTERTREIGIRIAVGAHPRDILLQFVVEAATLACLGGAIGLALGVGATAVVRYTLKWPTLISPLAVASSLISAGVIGVFSGFYPAMKAANLNPIDALRTE
ncbi:FtsX-like permease family protein [bacterium]|nr:FtsX-like permease family protein [bacterium]